MKKAVWKLLCGALAMALVPAGAGAFKRTEVGDTLRDFALESFSGEPVRLAEHRGAKATVVVFWAAWSPRSAEILADLQELYAVHGPENLRVVAVNVERQSWDPAEAAPLAEAFRKAGATYPGAVDKGLAVFQEWGVVAVPSAALADATGTIRALSEGYSTAGRAEFREQVAAALGLRTREPAAGQAAAGGYEPKGKAARYVQLGKNFLRKHMEERAADAFQKALEEDPDYAEARELLAQAQAPDKPRADGDPAQAEPALSQRPRP